MTTNLSAKQLRLAAAVRRRIESLENKLARILGGTTDEVVTPRKRRRMSAAGRARIAAAQRARWAKARGVTASARSVRKPKRKMSAAGRARIAAAARKRWRKAKAAGRNSL
jgi:hypothetical protein